jgi:hypothetical protein
MPLKKIPYKTLGELIKKNLSLTEETEDEQLFKSLSLAKKRGWLIKSELITICKWKSARAIRHIESNTPQKIKKHTQAAFSSKSEMIKIEELTKLRGVSIPMASAILTLTNPKRYGVIDIRVWELLYKIGSVQSNPNGINFKFREWYRLIVILRYHANKLDVTVRDIERIIFKVHKKYQSGRLYKK